MTARAPKETLSEARVTYTIEMGGRVIVIENVPARVCAETGERFFSPETVERIHQIIGGGQKPARIMQTPVFEFAA